MCLKFLVWPQKKADLPETPLFLAANRFFWRTAWNKSWFVGWIRFSGHDKCYHLYWLLFAVYLVHEKIDRSKLKNIFSCEGQQKYGALPNPAPNLFFWGWKSVCLADDQVIFPSTGPSPWDESASVAHHPPIPRASSEDFSSVSESLSWSGRRFPAVNNQKWSFPESWGYPA